MDTVFNKTLEAYVNSTQGQELDNFLGNEEYKWAVEQAIQESLGMIASSSQNDTSVNDFVEITNANIGKILNATSVEDLTDSEAIANLEDNIGESIVNTTSSIFDLIAESIANAPAPAPLPPLEPLPPIGEPLPPPAPIDQEALDAFGSIFEEGFKNIGIMRLGSRTG